MADAVIDLSVIKVDKKIELEELETKRYAKQLREFIAYIITVIEEGGFKNKKIEMASVMDYTNNIDLVSSILDSKEDKWIQLLEIVSKNAEKYEMADNQILPSITSYITNIRGDITNVEMTIHDQDVYDVLQKCVDDINKAYKELADSKGANINLFKLKVKQAIDSYRNISRLFPHVVSVINTYKGGIDDDDII